MQAANKEHLYKLLVIGDLGVGKTSIIKRYVHQNFSSHYRATIGVDFALKVLHWDPDTVVRLQLWDIAGENPGRRSRAGGGASQPVPSPQQKGGGQGGEPGLRGRRAAERDSSCWVGKLVSKKTKKFLAVAETCSAFSDAWSCGCNSLPHALPGAFWPARPPRTQRGTIWSCIQFLASSSFSGLCAPAVLLVTRP